jgi:hypothetical protein
MRRDGCIYILKYLGNVELGLYEIQIAVEAQTFLFRMILLEQIRVFAICLAFLDLF